MPKRKLVLYSNQQRPGSDTLALDRRLFSLISKRNPRIGYIPSSADPEGKYYRERREFYAHYGADLAVNFGLDKADNSRELSDLLACDAIHLSGGNTFEFAHRLAARRLIDPLLDYSERGGVMIGVSAGAILLTSHISTALLCGDDATDDRAADPLGLVAIAFIPHLIKEVAQRSIYEDYARTNATTLYACTDSSGLVVSGPYIECVGEHWKLSGQSGIQARPRSI